MPTKPFIDENNCVNLAWAARTKDNNFINFGDELSLFIHTRAFPEYSFRHCHFDSKKEKVSGIGTILHGFCGGKTHVWGTGLDASRFRPEFASTDLRVYAVRGKTTKMHLEKLGHTVPDVFGDPAILLPKFIKKTGQASIKLGIIPHCSNYEHNGSEIQRIKSPCFISENPSEMTVISPLTLGTVEDVIQQILSCDFVLSESIHGCIISDVLNVPNMFLQKNKEFNCHAVPADELTFLEHRYSDYLTTVNTKKFVILHNPALPFDTDKIIRRIHEFYEPCSFELQASLLLENHPLNV